MTPPKEEPSVFLAKYQLKKMMKLSMSIILFGTLGFKVQTIWQILKLIFFSRLSFIGLFDKPSDASEQINDPPVSPNKSFDIRSVKRCRSESPSENIFDKNSSSSSPKRSKILEESNSKIIKPVDPSTSTISSTDVYSVGFEEDEDNVNSFKSAKFVASKAFTKNPNENFVRINLKKKNYVRGKKTMTGPKYRRQEWKRKNLEKQKKESSAKKIPASNDCKKSSKKKGNGSEENFVFDEDSRFRILIFSCKKFGVILYFQNT